MPEPGGRSLLTRRGQGIASASERTLRRRIRRAWLRRISWLCRLRSCTTLPMASDRCTPHLAGQSRLTSGSLPPFRTLPPIPVGGYGVVCLRQKKDAGGTRLLTGVNVPRICASIHVHGSDDEVTFGRAIVRKDPCGALKA